jgi:hypothetical protein
MDQVVDIKNSGSDPSIGRSKEIFGTSIQVESDVLRVLCPKGATSSVRKELVKTAVDVVSLPGKLSGELMTTMW